MSSLWATLLTSQPVGSDRRVFTLYTLTVPEALNTSEYPWVLLGARYSPSSWASFFMLARDKLLSVDFTRISIN